MAKFYTEADADLDFIRSRRIAVLGYGSQGRSQALNLRDTGLDVIIGVHRTGVSHEIAEHDRFRVTSVEEAAKTCDLLVFCLPDVGMGATFAAEVHPHLRPGQALVFAHGFNIRFGLILPPSEVDVVLVSPKGAGPGVRRNYEEGFGVPALIAIHQDATGRALDAALGYAWGIGSARVMMMATTFAEETETDLFGEQAVLCGGLPELIKAAFETLVDAGYQPEAAYFECLHETKLIVDLLYTRGLTGLREKISDTAEWGGFLAGPQVIDAGTRERMRGMLGAIQTGRFSDEWIEENVAGLPHLKRLREEERSLLIEAVGRELRRKMGLEELED